MSAVSSLITELKRRNILKVATAYAVAGFIILQLCDIIFPAVGLADALIGYVLIGLALGLPLVTSLAWMFEITPEGLRRTREVSKSESISQFTGQRINNIIILLLSVALAFFAWEYFNRAPVTNGNVITTEATPIASTEEVRLTPAQEVDARPSIAVLPFVNMSSDKENEYFSDGLSEEVLNLLAQIPGLRVAGRTSSFFYKDKNEQLPVIGEALNVDHILEGSVRKSGNKVRITAQLISASDGFHLWSKTFDREIHDIFAVQDEIAGEVTRAMEVTLLTDGVMITDRATTNAETYDLYLRAKNALYDRGLENVRLSTELFNQALILDPEYGPAHLNLAVAELLLNWNYGVRTLDESLENAWEALEKAEHLGLKNSDYYAVLGLYYSHSVTTNPALFSKAEAAYQKAIDMNPNNVRAYMWWSTLLSSQSSLPDRFERALALNSEAKKLDPLNRIANGNHAGNLADVGRADEAISELNRLIRIDPEYGFYRVARTNLYLSLYDYVSAAQSLETAPRSLLQYPFHVLSLFNAFDDTESFLDFIDSIPVDNPALEYIHLVELALTATTGELRAEAEVLLLKADPDFYAFPVIFGLVNHGEYDLVRRLIENARVNFKSELPTTASSNGQDPRMTYLVSIYKLGQVDRSKRYAKLLLEANVTARYLGPGGKGINDATCYLVLGEHEKAIEELVRAASEGWLGYYGEQLTQDPLWQPFLTDPRVQQVKADIDTQLASQKKAVYQTLMEQGIVNSI